MGILFCHSTVYSEWLCIDFKVGQSLDNTVSVYDGDRILFFKMGVHLASYTVCS